MIAQSSLRWFADSSNAVDRNISFLLKDAHIYRGVNTYLEVQRKSLFNFLKFFRISSFGNVIIMSRSLSATQWRAFTLAGEEFCGGAGYRRWSRIQVDRQDSYYSGEQRGQTVALSQTRRQSSEKGLRESYWWSRAICMAALRLLYPLRLYIVAIKVGNRA